MGCQAHDARHRAGSTRYRERTSVTNVHGRLRSVHRARQGHRVSAQRGFGWGGARVSPKVFASPGFSDHLPSNRQPKQLAVNARKQVIRVGVVRVVVRVVSFRCGAGGGRVPASMIEHMSVCSSSELNVDGIHLKSQGQFCKHRVTCA